MKTSVSLEGPLVKFVTFLFLVFSLFGAQLLGAGAALANEDEVEETSEYNVLGNVKLEGVPLAGVEITVEGPDFSQTVATDEDGKWSVRVPEKNIYSVVLDESTLPEGIAVVDGAAQQEVEFGLTDNAVRNFFIGEGERNEVGFAGQLFSRIIYGLNFGLMLALASVGLSLIYGTTKLSNFAHAEFVTFGAIAVLFFSFALQLPTAVAIILGVVASGFLGWASDAGLWKPLRKRGLGLVPLMIVSIGLALTLRYVYQFFIGGGTIQLPGSQSPTYALFGTLTLSLNSIISMAVSIVVLLALSWWLLRTQMGKATRAISDNPDLASVAGIDTEKVIRVVWILSGALAGLGGILWAYFRPGVKWDMGEKILLLMFAAVILGGLGTAFGALVGSIVVGLLMEVSALFIPDDLKYVGALGILIATLLIKPSGIFGRKERVG